MSPSPSSGDYDPDDTPFPADTTPGRGRSRGGSLLVPLLLLFLALIDLRVELQLLVDRFTLTSVLAAIRYHLLAVVVLLLQPSLWRHYRRRHP